MDRANRARAGQASSPTARREPGRPRSGTPVPRPRRRGRKPRVGPTPKSGFRRGRAASAPAGADRAVHRYRDRGAEDVSRGSAPAGPRIRKAPPHAGNRDRCSLPGLAELTGQRWQDHETHEVCLVGVESSCRCASMERWKSKAPSFGPDFPSEPLNPPNCTFGCWLLRVSGGGEGIRTPGTVPGTHDFQSCTFDHSVTPPGIRCFGGRVQAPKTPSNAASRNDGRRKVGANFELPGALDHRRSWRRTWDSNPWYRSRYT